MVRKIVMLGGFRADGNAEPAIQMTPLSRAFASAPGLSVLLDPEFRTADGGANNLAAAGSVAANNSSGTGAGTGSFANGAPGFQATDANQAQFISPVDLNRSAWSVMWVTNIVARTGGVHLALGPIGDSDNGPSLPRVGFQGNDGTVFAANEGHSNAFDGRFLAFKPTPTLIGRTVVSTWTCSGGTMRFFLNGEQRAEAPAPTFNRKHLAGDFCFMRYARGLIGNLALFASDLSSADMRQHHQRITDFLMQKYGIIA